MSFSYDNTLADDLSIVRFLIQDNIEVGHYLEDEEITYLLTETGNIHSAAADACFSLYTRFSQALTVAEVDDIRIETKDRIKHYKDLYAQFKKKAATNNGKMVPIFIGGADRTEFIKESRGISQSNIDDSDVGRFFDRERYY